MIHGRAAKIGPLQWPRQWCGCRNAVCGRPGGVYTLVLCHPLRCAAHLQLCGSGLEKQGPYAGNSFLISCPLRLVFDIFSFRFLPLPFSHSPSPLPFSLSLLFAPDIYPLVPPWAVGSASQANQVAFSSFFVACSASCSLVPATATFHTAKTDDLFSAPLWVRDSLSLSLQQRPRGCPLNSTMLLLLSSAQLCRLVCSTRAQRSQWSLCRQ